MFLHSIVAVSFSRRYPPFVVIQREAAAILDSALGSVRLDPQSRQPRNHVGARVLASSLQLWQRLLPMHMQEIVGPLRIFGSFTLPFDTLRSAMAMLCSLHDISRGNLRCGIRP